VTGEPFNQSAWDGGNFELLRPDARRALALAQEEIERSGLRWSGTIEHLLIGLARAKGPAQALFDELGVDVDTARANLGIEHKDDAGRIPSRVVIHPVIPHSNVAFVIKLGFQVGRALSIDSVGGEHLLLAILLDGESTAAHFLEAAGAGLEPVCQRLGADVEVVRATTRPAGFK
jgi:ATP-dependent Clp protease ATP-binding subunit ClpA